MAATTGVDNTGTATIASLAAVSPLDQSEPDRDHHLHRQPRQLQLQPGRHHRHAADRQRHRQLRRRPADRPQRLRARSSTACRTAADSLVVARTAFPAGDNGNANALLGLRDRAIVGQQDLGGGIVAPGMNVTDAYAAALGTIGVRVQSGAAAAEQSAAIAGRRQQPRSARSRASTSTRKRPA